MGTPHPMSQVPPVAPHPLDETTECVMPVKASGGCLVCQGLPPPGPDLSSGVLLCPLHGSLRTLSHSATTLACQPHASTCLWDGTSPYHPSPHTVCKGAPWTSSNLLGATTPHLSSQGSVGREGSAPLCPFLCPCLVWSMWTPCLGLPCLCHCPCHSLCLCSRPDNLPLVAHHATDCASQAQQWRPLPCLACVQTDFSGPLVAFVS